MHVYCSWWPITFNAQSITLKEELGYSCSAKGEKEYNRRLRKAQPLVGASDLGVIVAPQAARWFAPEVKVPFDNWKRGEHRNRREDGQEERAQTRGRPRRTRSVEPVKAWSHRSSRTPQRSRSIGRDQKCPDAEPSASSEVTPRVQAKSSGSAEGGEE